MSLPSHPIPAPGFKLVSGLRGPRKKDAEYMVQYRTGYIDKFTYTAAQMVWTHDTSLPENDRRREWEIVAVKEV